jgi:polyisoprenoid-binding protein YceI
MFFALMFACSENPAEQAIPAVLEEPPAAPAEPAGPVGEPVAVDAAVSSIGFVGAKVTGSHEGHFKTFDGKLFVHEGVATGTEFTIQTGSVWADADDLTGHLQDEDFFFVEKFPTATFTSTKIEGGTVTGIFDFRGVQKELSFPATIEVGETATTMKSEFSLNRKDWGVMYAGKADNLIEDLVLIKLDLTFPKA